MWCDKHVSIHAPAWGATQPIWPALPHGLVSIHAPAWGATQCSHRQNPAECSFNPRARVGRDASACAAAKIGTSFNPRARVGRDLPGTLVEPI